MKPLFTKRFQLKRAGWFAFGMLIANGNFLPVADGSYQPNNTSTDGTYSAGVYGTNARLLRPLVCYGCQFSTVRILPIRKQARGF